MGLVNKVNTEPHNTRIYTVSLSSSTTIPIIIESTAFLSDEQFEPLLRDCASSAVERLIG